MNTNPKILWLWLVCLAFVVTCELLGQTNVVTPDPIYVVQRTETVAKLDWNSLMAIWLPILLAALVAWLKARTAQITNDRTAAKVEEVSHKVDGQHTAMLAKTDAQTAEILSLSKDKATLSESKHGAEVAAALKETPK